MLDADNGPLDVEPEGKNATWDRILQEKLFMGSKRISMKLAISIEFFDGGRPRRLGPDSDQSVYFFEQLVLAFRNLTVKK